MCLTVLSTSGEVPFISKSRISCRAMKSFGMIDVFLHRVNSEHLLVQSSPLTLL
jgi:hypothetical protein